MISDENLDELIKKHKIYRLQAHRIDDKKTLELISDVISGLQELKQYRECELRPAIKFLGNTIGKQLTQIQQEFKEVESELKYEYFNKENAMEELVDLQTACETMLAILGLDAAARADVRRHIISKNEARGYFVNSKETKEKNKFNQEADELSKAAAPLIELMQRKYNPHNKIIVTLDRIEVLSGEMGVLVEVQD